MKTILSIPVIVILLLTFSSGCMQNKTKSGKAGTTPHPYFHAKTEATAARDMIRAARDFCKNQNITKPDIICCDLPDVQDLF